MSTAAEHALAEAPEDVPEGPHLELVAAPGPMASMAADLRSYLPTRADLRAPLRGVGAGTRVLAGQGWAWVRADGWVWDGFIRLGAVAGSVVLGGPVLWTAVGDAAGIWAPYLPPVVVACACAVARWHSPEAREEREEQAEERAEIAAEEAAAKAKAKAKAKAARVKARKERGEGGEDDDGQEQEHDGPEDQEHDDVLPPLDLGTAVAVIRRVAARHPRHLGVHLSD
ncbi:hypothetical protein ACFVG1_36685, partial [Streptomyces bacillaris]|uniref:hypothetical protein n=1 Tax=Streptomyces bacillaris TaxID=68179 RepID=UPI003635BDB5